MRIKPLFTNIESSISMELEKTNSEIKVVVTWFTNHKLYNVILAKAKEGKDCSVIILNDKINRGSGINWQDFILAGGNLFFPKPEIIVHHKFSVIDASLVISGSYNWTINAENRNFENILRVEGRATARKFSKEFLRLCSFCDPITVLDAYPIYMYSLVREEFPTIIQCQPEDQSEKEILKIHDRAIMHRLGTNSWWEVTLDDVLEDEYYLSWEQPQDSMDNNERCAVRMIVSKDDSRYAILKYSEDYIRDKKLFKVPVNLPLE
jgi:hypothetical protein